MAATIDLSGCRRCNRFERCRAEGIVIVWTMANDLLKDQNAVPGPGMVCPKETDKLLEDSGFEL